MELGTRIRQARTKVGLSIRDLAALLGVSHATVGHWETGTHAPSVAALLKVAEITQADIAWFFSSCEPVQKMRVISEVEADSVGGGWVAGVLGLQGLSASFQHGVSRH